MDGRHPSGRCREANEGSPIVLISPMQRFVACGWKKSDSALIYTWALSINQDQVTPTGPERYEFIATVLAFSL
ncbi:hypothetical protein GWI33_005651 [Rhynchophorus ferrugineus]|uniref:Uncharacterized protein n=1 Tax=Rhynchophorus ferrugineus TaxID=354439 RepID=A0A834IJR8_RHYFE|nr:hypothetical protein GWI33_005651 [Rhynchophorus ferrugineus]